MSHVVHVNVTHVLASESCRVMTCMCDVTHSNVSRDQRIHMCDMTHSYIGSSGRPLKFQPIHFAEVLDES